jgi:hypothetical protein
LRYLTSSAILPDGEEDVRLFDSKYVNFKPGALKLKVFRRTQGRLFPLRTSEGQINMSGVWSCNEWDQLEEGIVGNPLNAR